jgi:hypothetical protein
VCTTRKQTGVGYPQLSAVLECADSGEKDSDAIEGWRWCLRRMVKNVKWECFKGTESVGCERKRCLEREEEEARRRRRGGGGGSEQCRARKNSTFKTSQLSSIVPAL